MSTNTDLCFLVVDDFSTMRCIVRGLLKQMGWENVKEAEDGAVALRMLKTQKFDFIVSDIEMPNLDGFELLKACKADDALKHIPVIFLTAKSQKKEIEAGLELGAIGYLVKPFDPMTLADELKKLVDPL